MQTFIQKNGVPSNGMPSNRIFLLHFSFWCVYFSFFFYQITFSRHGEETNYLRAFLDASSQIFFTAIVSYLNYFYWLPRFLLHKNIGRYFLEFFVPFVLIVTLHLYLKRHIYIDLKEAKGFLYSTKFIVQHSMITFFIAIFVGMLRFAQDWFDLEAKKKEIENERLTAELRF